jgi:two-component system response regulator
MSKATAVRPIEVLMAEDNRDDIALTMATLEDMKIHINVSVVGDGVETMEYLHKRGKYSDVSSPDLILLDLNMPRKDGREVLEEIKQDKNLKRIPVVVLTTSEAEEDILRAYDLHANCYISKPVDLDQFTKVVRAIDQFWFSIVKLP